MESPSGGIGPNRGIRAVSDEEARKIGDFGRGAGGKVAKFGEKIAFLSGEVKADFEDEGQRGDLTVGTRGEMHFPSGGMQFSRLTGCTSQGSCSACGRFLVLCWRLNGDFGAALFKTSLVFENYSLIPGVWWLFSGSRWRWSEGILGSS